jgi:hypothetical protein
LPQPITRARIEYVIGVILFPLSLLAFTASHLLGTGILLFSLAFLDPAQSIPAAEIQKVELKFAQARRNLESELQKGPARLQFLNTKAAGDREPIESQIQTLIKDHFQIKTDLDATPKT